MSLKLKRGSGAKHLMRSVWVLALLVLCSPTLSGHNVYFCGERIPIDNNFVANKLMDVIRRQVPNVNLPSLRQRAQTYFPIVSSYLKKYNLPDDLKYLAIVESGFVSNAESRVGARGFWQFMPATAKDYGLSIGGVVDDRDDIHKSTLAACKLFIDYFKIIQRLAKVSSWSLTCAAYNNGPGNVMKAVRVQGTNYYTMELNKETSLYVYKIIAVKELFEYPELYMAKFGYNVFSAKGKPTKKTAAPMGDETLFERMKLEQGGPQQPRDTSYYIAAHISSNPKFEDGDFVAITLDEDLKTNRGMLYKGANIAPKGWVIDDRVMVDLGYGHNVLLYDLNMKKGIEVNDIKVKSKRGVPILLKVTYSVT